MRVCFSTHLDVADHTQVYDEAYWTEDDPDWTGKVGQTLRLVMISNAMIGKHPAKLDILDFGCGVVFQICTSTVIYAMLTLSFERRL
jgi:hypothetical protein